MEWNVLMLRSEERVVCLLLYSCDGLLHGGGSTFIAPPFPFAEHSSFRVDVKTRACFPRARRGRPASPVVAWSKKEEPHC